MPSEIMRVGIDGALTPHWSVVWLIPNRESLTGTATHVKEENGLKKYCVRFRKRQRWIKETELEF